jgi:hypothetical protein
MDDPTVIPEKPASKPPAPPPPPLDEPPPPPPATTKNSTFCGNNPVQLLSLMAWLA